MGRSRSVLRLHRSSAASLTRGLARYPTAVNASDCMGEDTDGPMIRILFAVSPTHYCGTELARITFACLSDPSHSQMIHNSSISQRCQYSCRNVLPQYVFTLHKTRSNGPRSSNAQKQQSTTDFGRQSSMDRCITIPVRRRLYLTSTDH